MANNYTYTSMSFSIPKRARRWLEARLKENQERFESDNDFFWGFNHEFEAYGKDALLVYLFDEDGCPNLDALVEMLQLYLINFEPQRYLSFMWADTCSKPRPGEFGGGAVMITAKKVKYFNTYDWIHNETERLEKEIAKGKKKAKAKVSRKARPRV